MELNPIIEKVLKQIGVVERYEVLSADDNEVNTPLNERLRYIDGEIIIEIVESLEYSAGFNSKEKFFFIKDEPINNQYKTLVKFDLKGGMAK